MCHVVRVLPILVGLLLSSGQILGQPVVGNDIGCTIIALRTAAAVSIRGEIHAPAAATGNWSLKIRKDDAAGRSAISQNGRFELDASGVTDVGGAMVSLRDDGEIVAEMSLSLTNDRVTCVRRVKGLGSR